MTDRELRKLRRGELLEMLLEKSREVEKLKAELDTMKETLQERTIEIEQSGSIAEAALKLNGVFEAAQRAADQYLENAAGMQNRQEKLCEEQSEECRRNVQKMMAEAKRECEQLREKTDRECEEKLKETDCLVAEKWAKISENLESFYQTHEGLRELIEFSRREQKADRP